MEPSEQTKCPPAGDKLALIRDANHMDAFLIGTADDAGTISFNAKFIGGLREIDLADAELLIHRYNAWSGLYGALKDLIDVAVSVNQSHSAAQWITKMDKAVAEARAALASAEGKAGAE